MPMESRIFAMARHPITHTIKDKMRKIIPVGSKLKKDTRYLQRIVKMGENK